MARRRPRQPDTHHPPQHSTAELGTRLPSRQALRPPLRRYAGHCPDRHGGGAVATEVKSRAGNRTIGIPMPLVAVLRRHKASQDRERDHAADLWVEQGWVFTNRLGGPVHPRVDHDAWKNLLKKADVRDARLHDARHTAATMLLLLGVPSRAVMDIMGWSQSSMTTRYQRMTPELTLSIANQDDGPAKRRTTGYKGTGRRLISGGSGGILNAIKKGLLVTAQI